MKNLHELSRCMKTLAGYYDRANGKGAFKKLDDDTLEMICDAIGARTEDESVVGWAMACKSIFNS